MELTDYIRERLRPWPWTKSPEAHRDRPSTSDLARGLGMHAGTLDHRLNGRQNWTDHEVARAAEIIGGDHGEMRRRLSRDRAQPGALRAKRGQPRKVDDR